LEDRYSFSKYETMLGFVQLGTKLSNSHIAATVMPDPIAPAH